VKTRANNTGPAVSHLARATLNPFEPVRNSSYVVLAGLNDTFVRIGSLVAVEDANRGTERMIYRSEPILMDVFAGQNSACHWAQPRK